MPRRPPWQAHAAHLLAAVLLSALPLVPPLMRGIDLDAPCWLTHLLVAATTVGVYYLNLYAAVPRLLFRGHWALYALLLGPLTAGNVAWGLRVVTLPAGPLGRTGMGEPSAERRRHTRGDLGAIMALSTLLVFSTGTLRAVSRRSQQERASKGVGQWGGSCLAG